MVTQPADLRTGLLRVVRRPGPWILRYILVTLPALVLALAVTLSLTEWFRLPLWIEALETQSIDLLLEIIESRTPEELSGVSLALLALPVLWVIIRVVWLFFEGGVLSTYHQPTALTWREFLEAGVYWFGSFLLLGGMGALATVLWVAITAGIGFLAAAVEAFLSTVILVVGLLGLVALWLWIELARVVAVVRQDRHVFRSLTGVAGVVRARAPVLLGLVVGVFVLLALLGWVSTALGSAMPLTWWLPVLVLQQVAQLISVGVVLARKGGEVALVSQVEALRSESEVLPSADERSVDG